MRATACTAFPPFFWPGTHAVRIPSGSLRQESQRDASDLHFQPQHLSIPLPVCSGRMCFSSHLFSCGWPESLVLFRQTRPYPLAKDVDDVAGHVRPIQHELAEGLSVEFQEKRLINRRNRGGAGFKIQGGQFPEYAAAAKNTDLLVLEMDADSAFDDDEHGLSN